MSELVIVENSIKKQCTKCKEYKFISEFYPRKHGKYGVMSWCKICDRKYALILYNRYFSLDPEKFRRRHIKNRNLNPHRYWSRGAIHGHKKNGFIVGISTDFLEDLAKNTKNCRYCNRELNYLGNMIRGGSHMSPSLDRINNEKDLREDNIQIICRQCNASKSNRTHDDFVKYCQNIAVYFGIFEGVV